MSKNSVRLNICGIECVVGAMDSETYVKGIAKEVADTIEHLSQENEHASATVTATVAALSYCDDYKKAAADAEKLRAQIKDYLADTSRARLEAEEAQKEIGRLKKEVASLRARLGEKPIDQPAPRANAPIQRTGTYTKTNEEIPEQEGFVNLFQKTHSKDSKEDKHDKT